MTTEEAMKEIERSRVVLLVHEVQTLRGQVRAGDIEGAMKGLHKLVSRRRAKDGV